MINCLFVAAGGAVGAVSRYLIGLLPLGAQSGFPAKTFLINLAGAFLIGVIAALAEKHALNPYLVNFLKIGVCGGFTTFSTFALETSQLLHKGSLGLAFLYICGSVIFCVAAVFLGQSAVH